MKPVLYKNYKYSGVEWLGEVPEYWNVLKLRDILRRTAERNRPDLPLLSVVREKGVIMREVNNKEENHNFIPDDLTNYKVIRVGQFAMNKMKAWQGSYGISLFDGIVSPAYYTFYLSDVSGICGDYFHVAIRSKAYIPFFAQASDGVRIGQWDLSQVGMREIPFAVPSPPEQKAIVRYLNYFDRRIRRYTAAKQRLIGLLEEQKQVIIHRAVTRGLNPDVPIKDSGVEWLGKVPAHWEVRRIKSLSSVKRGASPRPIAESRYFDEQGEYAWVRIADVTASERYLEKTTQRLSELGQSLSVTLQPGSLFLSIAGSVGKSIITKIKCCIHDGFVYFPSFQGNVEFLYRVFVSGKLFARLGKIGTQLNLNTDTVGGIFIGWPPEQEQTAIVKYLDKATATIDAAITRARREIELLNEYRTRLTADVVTGKLDVREAAAELPDEPDEPELPDENDTSSERVETMMEKPEN